MALEGAGAVPAPTEATGKAITGLSVLLVVGGALHFLGGMVADPDLWAHLQYGRMIWDGQGLPTVEVFSYTAPGAPFYDHEWLTDFVFAGVYLNLGAAGLVAGKLLLLASMLLLLLDAARVMRDLFAPGMWIHPLTAALVTVLGLAVIGPGATFRAQLFTMAFLALEASLLARAERRRSRTSDVEDAWPEPETLLIPPLLLLWANLHGGFLVGLGMLGLYAAATAFRLWRRWRDGADPWAVGRRVALLSGVCLAAAAAPLANPYGWELYAYLASTLGMHGQISEWYPVGVFSDDFLRFKLLVVLSVVGVAALWPRTSKGATAFARTALSWRAAFLVVAAYMAFRHQRHTVLFGIFATPLAIVAGERLRRLAIGRFPALRPRRPVFAALAVGATAVAVFQTGAWLRQVAEHGVAIRYGRLDYPVDAVEFLKRYGFAGNLAMPFEWGAYAITKMAPAAKVFIDGRFEAVYPPKVIEDYFAFMNGTPGWERLLDDYPTDIVVVQRWRQIHARLFARDDLVYVYSDPASLVFVRPGPRTDAALQRLAAAEDRNDFPRLATYFP